MPRKPGVRCFGSMKAHDGSVLATLRATKLKLSQPEFAHKVGVGPATISRAEQGIKISKTSACAIADALGETIERLFADDVSIAIPEEETLRDDSIPGDALKGVNGSTSTTTASRTETTPEPEFGTKPEI